MRDFAFRPANICCKIVVSRSVELIILISWGFISYFFMSIFEKMLLSEKLKPLPDILNKNLKILFVGTSPGVKSSKMGHYFAGHSNVFWKLLYESRLTDKLLKTEKDWDMLDFCYGLTDVVKEPTRSVTDIKKQYTIKSRRRLNRMLNMLSPKILVFVGKMGFRIYSHDYDSKLEYGYQYTYNEVRVFLLPSTSGQSYADTKYDEKLYWYRNLRQYSNRIQ